MLLYEPFDTRLVEARLRSQLTTTQLREVEGAAEFASITGPKDYPTPCAFVVLQAESGGGTLRQAKVAPASALFAVVLAVSNFRDRRGEQLQPELRTLLGLTRKALIGWQPDAPGCGPVAWRAGEVMDYDDATLLWADAYQCTHVLQP